MAAAKGILLSLLLFPLSADAFHLTALSSKLRRSISISHHVMMTTTTTDVPNSSSSQSPSISSSLASSYAIRINAQTVIDEGTNELRWELHSLSQWGLPDQGEGTWALRALKDCALVDYDYNEGGDCMMSCQWKKSTDGNDDNTWMIHVDAVNEDSESDVPNELLLVLSRIMAQSAASLIDTSEENDALLHITLPIPEGRGCQKLLLKDLSSSSGDPIIGVRQLFTPLNSDYANMEIVDMVDQDGQVLGSLPRPYIHTWNILHRGIGMIVSKDVDILDALKSGKVPEVYCHQRTSTKRIFPSLYDMFVGGVSSAGEDAKLTAAREVAEELGLKRALEALEGGGRDDNTQTEQNNNNPLSEKLFQCYACTSYNRCVVSIFTYTCDTSIESITWQEEEVAWGDYVPYDVVEVAGELSIERLVEQGVWPGSETELEKKERAASNTGTLLKSNVAETWDFVPDGLLVWVAWKNFVHSQ